MAQAELFRTECNDLVADHSSQPPNVMYAGSAPIALYRRLDGGDTWHRLRNAISPAHCERAGFDSRVLRITVDPNRPDDVYAALEVSGVIRSTDGGETWSDMSAPLIQFAGQPRYQSNVGGRHCGLCEGMPDSHATAISPATSGTVFLGLRMGLFRSDDRGMTWHDTEIGRFSPLTYCHGVIVSTRDLRVLYTCLSPAAFSTEGSLYRPGRSPNQCADAGLQFCRPPRNAVRLRSDDAVPADIHRIRHSEEVPNVSDPLCHLV